MRAPLRVGVRSRCFPQTANLRHATDLWAISKGGHLIFGHFVEATQPKFPQLFSSTSAGQLPKTTRLALLVSFVYMFCTCF
jgi:hypothetical protein